MKHLKPLITLFTLFTLCTLPLRAQNISVTDFHLDEMDLTANQQGTTVLDQNGEKCALIKVETTQTGFTFDVGSLGVQKTEQKNGEIWVYVPAGVRKMTISHPQIGILRDYQLPVTTQRCRTYIMKLVVKNTSVSSKLQTLNIKVLPNNATILIDGEMVEGESIQQPVGTHSYNVVAKGYYSQSGTIEIKADQPAKLLIELDKKTSDVTMKSSSADIAQNADNIGKQKPAQPKGPSQITVQVKGQKIDMIRVDGGTFTMGATPELGNDADDDEKPAHQVTLSSYYICKYEVTQALWETVMGSRPKTFGGWDTENGIGPNLPAYQIWWNDCQKFINKLNQLTGKQFRMPTEAEWEYAARGGNKSHGYKFSGSNNPNDVAWYGDNALSKVHEVGTKKPNELGLYDMSGNVDEWCSDRYGNYSAEPQIDPYGPGYGENRIIRGGSIGMKERGCTCSCRSRSTPEFSNSCWVLGTGGLRLALSE